MSDLPPTADKSSRRSASPTHSQNALADTGSRVSDQSEIQNGQITGQSESDLRNQIASASPFSKSLESEPRPKPTSSSSLSKQLWANSIDDPQIDERDSIYTTTYFPSHSPPSSSFRPPRSFPSKSTHGESTSASKLPLAGTASRKVTFDASPTDNSSTFTTPKTNFSSQSTFKESINNPIDIVTNRLFTLSPTTKPSTLNRSKTVQMGESQDHGQESIIPQDLLGSPIRFSSSPPQYHGGGNQEHEGREAEERIRYRSWREGNTELNTPSGATRTRSKSRESRVDRKIEAILPKSDSQAKSTRSRKSSQYMGLFKENDASSDSSRRDRHPTGKEDKGSGKSKPQDETTLSGDAKIDSGRSQSDSIMQPIEEAANKVEQADVSDALRHSSSAPREQSQTSHRIAPDLHRKVLISEAGLAESLRKSSTSIEELEQQIDDQSLGAKQEHRNASVGSNESHAGSDVTERGRANSTGSIRMTEEDEESEKETISSATYIPHRQLRTATTSLLETSSRPTVLRTQSATVPQRLSHVPEEDAEETPESPHEVEISLKSQGREEVWHGAMNNPTQLAESPPEYESSQDFEGASSASGFESMDESVVSSAYDSDENTFSESPQTPKAPLPRRKSHRAREPMSAVPLKPFRHQVGGHNTVFQFSRKTICKKMNNRENVFYEVVEKYHPELLDFMPRYIGVLNVTFSKALKRKPGEPTSESKQPAASDQEAEQIDKSDIEHVSPQPRVISHSQQSMSIPQVIFEQNRHIIPDNLFRVPTSPITPAQLSPNDRDPRRLSHSRPLNPIESISRDSSPRPNIRTWGSTRVNRRLQEQVLREVFAPPVIHRHRAHGRHNVSTSELPLLPASVGSPSPVAAYQRAKSDVQQLYPDPAFVTEETGDQSEIGVPLHMSRTAPDDDAEYLDKRPISSGDSVMSASRSVRRRHSGSGLRRRPIDALSGIRSGLEFHEEDGYGADQEDEVFVMDKDDQLRGSASASSETGDAPPDNLKQLNAEPDTLQSSPSRDDTRVALARQSSEPKPSQTDARVEMFILLEDLTARMEKPCVLDLKMGTRQYGVEADEKKQRSQRKKCKMTTSRELGVRVCGMQVWNVKTESYLFEDKYFGRDLKAGAEFQAALARFFFDGLGYTSARRYIPVILDQISKLERIVRHLPAYRLYASSLLLIYDRAAEDCSSGAPSPTSPSDTASATLPPRLERASSGPPIHHATAISSPPRARKVHSCPIQIKIVDFANCVTKEDTSRLEQATIPPHDPNGVDRGYLRGLRTLKLYFQRIWKEVADVDYEERGEGEGELESRKGAWNDTALTWDDPGEVSV